MRLINSEDVKALINGLDSLPWEEEVDDLVDRIPTAFDVNDVMERLEELKNKYGKYEFGCLYERGRYYAFEDAIRIVKAGGIDEN